MLILILEWRVIQVSHFDWESMVDDVGKAVDLIYSGDDDGGIIAMQKAIDRLEGQKYDRKVKCIFCNFLTSAENYICERCDKKEYYYDEI